MYPNVYILIYMCDAIFVRNSFFLMGVYQATPSRDVNLDVYLNLGLVINNCTYIHIVHTYFTVSVPWFVCTSMLRCALTSILINNVCQMELSTSGRALNEGGKKRRRRKNKVDA